MNLSGCQFFIIMNNAPVNIIYSSYITFASFCKLLIRKNPRIKIPGPKNIQHYSKKGCSNTATVNHASLSSHRQHYQLLKSLNFIGVKEKLILVCTLSAL